MTEHMTAGCDCRVDGHHIGSRSLSIGLWERSLLHLEDCFRVGLKWLCAQYVMRMRDENVC